ncbi:MAG: hypothetical protein LBM61_04620 [Prevotellaceae bacterium]|jgi:hypothetical protein|nr:hypothetical protein [Prevotellaceae bacterium]
MIRPLEILKEQVLDYAERAANSSGKRIRLSEQELESFRFNFRTLCYEAKYGSLDEVFRVYFMTNQYKGGLYHETDLLNLLAILSAVEWHD